MMPSYQGSSLWEGRSAIHIAYGDLSVAALQGQTLLDALLAAGVDHRHICGGLGFCTSCRVEVIDGSANLTPVSALERERLGPEAGRLRLACQTCVLGPAAVRVPALVRPRFSPDGD